jgi:hypothetical protein
MLSPLLGRLILEYIMDPARAKERDENVAVARRIEHLNDQVCSDGANCLCLCLCVREGGLAPCPVMLPACQAVGVCPGLCLCACDEPRYYACQCLPSTPPTAPCTSHPSHPSPHLPPLPCDPLALTSPPPPRVPTSPPPPLYLSRPSLTTGVPSPCSGSVPGTS